MTPNITDITVPARACLDRGLDGISAINTVACIMSVDLDTLRPQPTVQGRSTPGGYSGRAVKPMALAKVAALAGMIAKDDQGAGGGGSGGNGSGGGGGSYAKRGASLSGIGGVETGGDAAEFLLLGCETVQVCTGVMLHGYPLVQRLCGGLQKFMTAKGFSSIDEFRGMALPYVTTHSDLVARQRGARKGDKVAVAAAAKAPAAAGGAGVVGLASDAEWTGDNFVADADSMVANNK
jgi:dihydropyrimidine dehydrogenase (NADP+)